MELTFDSTHKDENNIIDRNGAHILIRWYPLTLRHDTVFEIANKIGVFWVHSWKPMRCKVR